MTLKLCLIIHNINYSLLTTYLLLNFRIFNIDIFSFFLGLLANFRKLRGDENLLLTPFDYDSIMIYGNYAFSKDGFSKTMEAKNGQALLDPFAKSRLTESDIQRVRKLYKCEDS